MAFPAPSPFSAAEGLALHVVPAADPRPAPSEVPLDRPLLVVAPDELDAAAFAEVLVAHGARVVRFQGGAASPRSSA